MASAGSPPPSACMRTARWSNSASVATHMRPDATSFPPPTGSACTPAGEASCGACRRSLPGARHGREVLHRLQSSECTSQEEAALRSSRRTVGRHLLLNRYVESVYIEQQCAGACCSSLRGTALQCDGAPVRGGRQTLRRRCPSGTRRWRRRRAHGRTRRPPSARSAKRPSPRFPPCRAAHALRAAEPSRGLRMLVQYALSTHLAAQPVVALRILQRQRTVHCILQQSQHSTHQKCALKAASNSGVRYSWILASLAWVAGAYNPREGLNHCT